uniref:Alternative protein n=1 Tax=Ascaris lumbricoides TaxID=6252 RepID=A0A0M3IGP5_ASCLU
MMSCEMKRRCGRTLLPAGRSTHTASKTLRITKRSCGTEV